MWDHSFSTFPKLSKKVTFLTPCLVGTRALVYQGGEMLSFSENPANVVINEPG